MKWPPSRETVGRLRLCAGWGLCAGAFAGLTAALLLSQRFAEFPALSNRMLTIGAADAVVLGLIGFLLLRGGFWKTPAAPGA